MEHGLEWTCLDSGLFHFAFALLAVIGGLMVPAFLLEFEVGGAEVIAAEAGELALGIADAFPALVDIGTVAKPVLGGADEVGGGDGGKGIGDFPGTEAGVQGIGLFGELKGEVAGFPEFEPVLIAALAPFGEVLLGDGAAAKEFGEDTLDFGEGVEPGEELGAGGAVIDALVEFIAEDAGEAGDFAFAGGGHGEGWIDGFSYYVLRTA